MKRLQISNNYGSIYEQAHNLVSKNSFYNESDWLYAARHGELDAYINLLSRTNEIKDIQNFKDTYLWDYSNTKTRIAALNNELNADRTNTDEEREKNLYDEQGNIKLDISGKPLSEKYAASDYDYYKNIIIENNTYEYNKYLQQKEIEEKESLNAFTKSMATIAGIGSSFVSGFLGQLDNLSNTVSAIGNATKALFKGEDVSDAFVQTTASNIGRIAETSGWLDAISEFERKYTYIKDINGNYTNFGKIAGGVATSLGQMLPSLIVTKGLSATPLPDKSISGISSLVFYTGTTNENIKDTFRQLNKQGASVPTEAILLNSTIKSALQYGVELGVGKLFGTSSLDNMVFGRDTKLITSDSLTKSATKRLFKDFTSEGLEEVFQDTSDFLVDRAFPMFIKNNFGQFSELTFQSLMDSFIVGGIASFAGSAKQILSTKRINIASGVNEEGKLTYKKLNKLASWEYGLNIQSFVSNFDEIIKDTNKIKNLDPNSKEGKKYIAALTEMYTSYRMLASIYNEIGEERFKNANTLLTQITQYIKDGKFNTGYIRSAATDLYNSLQNMPEENAKKIIDKLAEKNITEAVDKFEKGEETEIPISDEAKDKVNQIANEILEKDKEVEKVIVTKDGEGVVYENGLVFVPLNYIENADASIIYGSIAEETLVKEISKGKFKGFVLKNVLDTFKKVSGRDNANSEEAIYNLLFNDSFFAIMLNTANKDMYQLLTSFVDIEKTIVPDNLKDETYKNKINIVINNMKKQLYNYCINQQNADYRLSIFTTAEQNKIASTRWCKDLYNRIINDKTFTKLTKTDWQFLNNRINYMPVQQSIKDKINEDLHSNISKVRRDAINKISQTYKGIFNTLYDGKTYMPETSIPNMCFNTFLRDMNLTIETLSNINIDTNTINLIINKYGDFNKENLIKFRQEQFMLTTNDKYIFRFDEQGKIGVYEFETNEQIGFNNFYADTNKEINLKDKNINIRTDKRNDLVQRLLNTNIDKVTAAYMNINDVISNPNVLNSQIKANIQIKYKDVNPETTFLYLREYFAKTEKNVSLIVLQDGSIAFGNTESMSKILNTKKLLTLLENEKSFNISEIISKKYIKGRIKDLQVVVGTFDINEAGQYNVNTNTITVNSKYLNNINYLSFCILHELQHAIQFENDMNLGMDGNWLKNIPEAKRKIFIKDIREHIPYLFKNIKVGSKEESDIVNNLVYDASGEYEANGYASSLTVNFYPFVVNHNYETTTITTPWGTSYDFKTGVKLNLVARNIFNKSIELISEDLTKFYDEWQIKKSKVIGNDIFSIMEGNYKERSSYDLITQNWDLLTNSIHDYIYQPIGGTVISKNVKYKLIEDIDKLNLKDEMIKLLYLNVVGFPKNMTVDDFYSIDNNKLPEYEKFINTDLPCIRLQQGSEIYDDAFLSFSIINDYNNLADVITGYMGSNYEYPNLYNMFYGTIKPTEILGYIGTDLREALLSTDIVKNMKYVTLDVGYNYKYNGNINIPYILENDSTIDIFKHNTLDYHIIKYEKIINYINKKQINSLYNNDYFKISPKLYSDKVKFLELIELNFKDVIYPRSFYGLINMRKSDINTQIDFINKYKNYSIELLYKTFIENGFNITFEEFLNSNVRYVGNYNNIKLSKNKFNNLVPVNIYFNISTAGNAIDALETNLNFIFNNLHLSDDKNIYYGDIKIKDIEFYIPNDANYCFINFDNLKINILENNQIYFDKDEGKYRYNIDNYDTSLSTNNDFIMQLKRDIFYDEKGKAYTKESYVKEENKDIEESEENIEESEETLVKKPKYRENPMNRGEFEKLSKDEWRQYNVKGNNEWISRYPRLKNGEVQYTENNNVRWKYDYTSTYYDKLLELNPNTTLKPKKSRYVSQKKNKGTNLEKYGYVKKYKKTTMSKELQHFIVNATPEIDSELWDILVEGKLTTSDIMDYLVKADNIDDITFKLINNSYFKNNHIKTFKELKNYIAKSSDYYALNVIMKSSKMNESLMYDNRPDIFNKLVEIFTNKDKDKNTFERVKNNYLMHKGQSLDINTMEKHLRKLWLTYFDGSVLTGGYLSAVAKKVARAGWNVTGSSESRISRSLDEEVKDGINLIDKIIAPTKYERDAFDFLIYSVDREHKVDELLKVIGRDAIMKYMLESNITGDSRESIQYIREFQKELRSKYLTMDNESFAKEYEKYVNNLSEDEINRLFEKQIILETSGLDEAKLTEKEQEKINKEVDDATNNIVRTSNAVINNVKSIVRTIKKNLTKNDEKRFLKVNSDIFDEKINIKKEVYENKEYSELISLEKRMQKLSKDVRAQTYKSKMAMDYKRKYEKAVEIHNKELLRNATQKNNKKVKDYKPVTVEIENNVVTINTTKEMPDILKRMLSKEFQRTGKSTTQYLTDEDSEHIVMHYKTFVENNAELLNTLTQEDANKLADYFLTSSPIGDTLRDRQYIYTQFYLSTFLIKGNKIGRFQLTEQQKTDLENRLESMVSIPAAMLSAWKKTKEILRPEEYIMNKLARTMNIEFNSKDIKQLSDAIEKGDIAKIKETKEKMYTETIKSYEGRKRNILDKILEFERIAMLSGPGTWIRNQTSNIILSGLNVSVEKIGSFAAKLIQKMFPKKKLHREHQYELIGTKVSSEVATFIKNNIVDNGLLELIRDGLNKYDIRKSRKQTSEQNLTDIIINKIQSDIFMNTTIKSKGIKKVYDFIYKMMSDNKFINKSTIRYLGKILTENKIDLSKGLTTEIINCLADAYILSAREFMHKENLIVELENKVKEKHPYIYFAWKQIFPFVGPAWNWFVEGLNYTPIGIIKGITNYVKLENTINKIEDARQKGKIVESSKFAEYIAIKTIGKGIIGSIGMLIGITLAACGLAGIDEEDEKYKLRVGEVKVDISDIFGTQGILMGISLTSELINSEGNIFDKSISALSETLNTLFQDSIYSDFYNLFRYNDTFTDFALYVPNNMLQMMIPNFVKTFSSIVSKYKVKYTPGILGKIEKLANQAIPFLSYAMPKYIDPYTGEKQVPYKLWFLTNLSNKLMPFKINTYNVTDYEKEAISLGIKKSMLNGKYTIGNDKINLKPTELEELNEFYGKLNKKDLTNLFNNRSKHRIFDYDKNKYVELTYNQMSAKQKAVIIERIMSNNNDLSKIYILTSSGKYKYFTNDNEYNELKKVGVIKNIYKSTKNQGYIKIK